MNFSSKITLFILFVLLFKLVEVELELIEEEAEAEEDEPLEPSSPALAARLVLEASVLVPSGSWL